MTALAANNTDRYFFHYSNAIAAHVAVVRTQAGAPPTGVIDAFESFCTALTPVLAASTGVNIEFQLAGTTFSVPVGVGDWTGFTFGASAAAKTGNAAQVNAVGRSSGGHRCRLGMFGFNNDFSGYRIEGAELSGLGDSVASILNGSTYAFFSIDDVKPTWYGYLDVKPNDYWVRKSR